MGYQVAGLEFECVVVFVAEALCSNVYFVIEQWQRINCVCVCVLWLIKVFTEPLFIVQDCRWNLKRLLPSFYRRLFCSLDYRGSMCTHSSASLLQQEYITLKH